MTPEKQVSFIERVSKSCLGLEGMQIVVYCDRKRNEKLSKEEIEECTFLEIGNEVLNKINGEYVKGKYGVYSGPEFGQRLHQERVIYLKNNIVNK